MAFVRFLLILLLCNRVCFAGKPLDIVFDIDQTIATLVHEHSKGDLLADPLNPKRGQVTINFIKDGKPLEETYRVYEGVGELLQKLKGMQDQGLIRVSFFSGGTAGRNAAILDAIKLPDGTSARSLAKNIFDRTHMVPTGAPETARIRQRFKKDLRIVNPDISDVILIDDIREFVPSEQLGHVLWTGEDFPYPDRIWELNDINPDATLLSKERRRFDWISEYLLSALEKRFKEDTPLSKIIDEATKSGTKTPFTPGEEVMFEAGRKRMRNPCDFIVFAGLDLLLGGIRLK